MKIYNLVKIMDDIKGELLNNEFKSKIQSILNGFSEPIDLIMFKYDVMTLIKNKIKDAEGDCHTFEINIDKECRLKHNETEIFEAQYIIELIKVANIAESFFFNFIHEIEDKAKSKKSYVKVENAVNRPKLVL